MRECSTLFDNEKMLYVDTWTISKSNNLFGGRNFRFAHEILSLRHADKADVMEIEVGEHRTF